MNQPNMSRTIRILLADDHTVLRNGLRLLLDRQPGFQVVAEARDGRETIESARKFNPDVILLDIAMPNLSGIEAARQINASQPDIAIIILSMHTDEGYLLRALKAGARGYLLKDTDESALITAINAVYEGKAFFSPAISKLLMEDYMRQLAQQGVEDSYELLSNREREVLQMLAEGKTNKDIANSLSLSPYTVESHRKAILQKLNLHSLAEVMLYAIRKGIIA
jgi:two-component system response regulator NreC